MPVISRFFGIVIAMYWRDHSPPHFHAKYADYEAEIDIETGAIIGHLPPRALGLVQEWRQSHMAELRADWKRAESRRALLKIRPLE